MISNRKHDEERYPRQRETASSPRPSGCTGCAIGATARAAGNATQEVIGGLSRFTSSLGFDDLYCSTSATDPTGTNACSHDADSNRLSRTVNGTTAAYTADAANRLTSVGGVPVTTDANGNILVDNTGKSYQWDAGAFWILDFGFWIAPVAPAVRIQQPAFSLGSAGTDR